MTANSYKILVAAAYAPLVILIFAKDFILQASGYSFEEISAHMVFWEISFIRWATRPPLLAAYFLTTLGLCVVARRNQRILACWVLVTNGLIFWVFYRFWGVGQPM